MWGGRNGAPANYYCRCLISAPAKDGARLVLAPQGGSDVLAWFLDVMVLILLLLLFLCRGVRCLATIQFRLSGWEPLMSEAGGEHPVLRRSDTLAQRSSSFLCSPHGMAHVPNVCCHVENVQHSCSAVVNIALLFVLERSARRRLSKPPLHHNRATRPTPTRELLL